MSAYTLNDAVAIIEVDDGKANAVGHSFIDTVNAGLDRAQSEARAVLLKGRPGMFSAGFDLKEFEKGPEATQTLVNAGGRLLLRLFSHPQPVVAACTGHAVAAGALLLLACDSRLGANGEFRIGLNETAIGMGLPVFALQLAAARLSRRHQTAAVIQARLFDPATAVDAGFLDEASDSVDTHALAVATELAKLPPEAYAANKRDSRAPFIETIAGSLS